MQAYISEYLRSDGSDIAWDFIKASMQSVSKTSIFLMQARVGNRRVQILLELVKGGGS